jgi:hypothetical protein
MEKQIHTWNLPGQVAAAQPECREDLDRSNGPRRSSYQQKLPDIPMIKAGFVEAKELVAAPPIKAVRMRKAPNDPSARGWKRPRMAGEATDRNLGMAEVATNQQSRGSRRRSNDREWPERSLIDD